MQLGLQLTNLLKSNPSCQVVICDHTPCHLLIQSVQQTSYPNQLLVIFFFHLLSRLFRRNHMLDNKIPYQLNFFFQNTNLWHLQPTVITLMLKAEVSRNYSFGGLISQYSVNAMLLHITCVFEFLTQWVCCFINLHQCYSYSSLLLVNVLVRLQQVIF